MKQLFFLIGALIALTACKEVYENPPQALVRATIWNSSTEAELSSKVSIHGIGYDNYWVKDSTIQKILLPLSPTDTSNYVFSFDSYTDTIIFIHTKKLKYESMETGLYYEYQLKSVDYTKNRLDSVEITDSLVTTIWNENIKLYLHPLSSTSN